MFFQTILQHLLRKRREDFKPTPEKDLSPMAQSIMQKLAEHEKNSSAAITSVDPKNAANKPEI
jgi:hypothetical protein